MAHPERTEGHPSTRKVGIVGAGQLARMLCESASELAFETIVLAEHDDDAAVHTAGEVLVGKPTDLDALLALAAACDVVTFDHELVDLDALVELEARGYSVRPGPRALAHAVDKAHQRQRFRDAGIAVPDFLVLDGTPDDDAGALAGFAARLGHVPVVKAARGGYDGHGVVVADSLDEAAAAVASWRGAGVAVVAEAKVAFRAELAALVARRPDGEAVSWRAVETAQVEGVCREIRVPGSVDDTTARRAEQLARIVADTVGVVGMLAVELFLTEDGLLVNEVALRPHNSGHWTIEGATTSQFENHLRAVLDLPLGATDQTADAVATVNVFGADDDSGSSMVAALSDPGAKVHLYGKVARPRRKLGHVTVLGTDQHDVAARAWRAASALGAPQPAQTGATP